MICVLGHDSALHKAILGRGRMSTEKCCLTTLHDSATCHVEHTESWYESERK